MGTELTEPKQGEAKMKSLTEQTTAKEVKDYSGGKDGSTTLNVDYSFTYDVLENDDELRRKFAPDALLNLANQRLKQTANSKARQEALKPYAQDPNTPEATLERIVKDMVSQGIPETVARNQVEQLFASAAKK